MMFFVCVFALIACVNSEKWELQQIWEDVQCSSTCTLHGRGASILTCGENKKVHVSYQGIDIAGEVKWERYAVISAPSTAVSFASSVDIARNGDHCYVMAIGAAGDEGESGAVYIYEGDWAEWTPAERLVAATASANDGFGSAVSMAEYRPDTLLVSAPLADETEKNAGAVYLFQRSFGAWTLSQHLLPADTSKNMQFGSHIASSQHFAAIAAAEDNSIYMFAAETFAYVGSNNEITIEYGTWWSQQQKLRLPQNMKKKGAKFHPNIVTISDDVLVTGDPSRHNDAGAVYIYHSQTNYVLDSLVVQSIEKAAAISRELGYVQKLREVTTWSFAQLLVSADDASCLRFGSSVAVYGDLLVVGAPGYAKPDSDFCSNSKHSRSGAVYIYGRFGAYWSLQQSVFSSIYDKDRQFGAEVLISGSEISIFDTKAMHQYDLDDDSRWNCLVVTVGDHFHDGWYGAQLVVTCPDGTSDAYSPSCGSPDPFVFRYCPSSVEDDGVYTFNITSNAVNGAYDWEVVWIVQLEQSSSQLLIGGVGTEMLFQWHKDAKQFSSVKLTNLVENDASCYTCSHLVNEQRRLVDQAKITAAPTMSTVDEDAMLLVLYDDGYNGWYHNTPLYTRYHITNIAGSEVFANGTLCTSGKATCLIDLQDGEYRLRVGGGVDANAGDVEWKFCNVHGASEHELRFRIENGYCSPVSLFQATDFCSPNLDVSVVLGGVYYIEEVNKDSLTSDDFWAMKQPLLYPFASSYETADLLIITYRGGIRVYYTAPVLVKALGFRGLYDTEVMYQRAAVMLNRSIITGEYWSAVKSLAKEKNPSSALLSGKQLSLQSSYLAKVSGLHTDTHAPTIVPIAMVKNDGFMRRYVIIAACSFVVIVTVIVCCKSQSKKRTKYRKQLKKSTNQELHDIEHAIDASVRSDVGLMNGDNRSDTVRNDDEGVVRQPSKLRTKFTYRRVNHKSKKQPLANEDDGTESDENSAHEANVIERS